MIENRPSAYIPFFRRFRDERAVEIEETHRLYEWVKAKQDGCGESITTIGKRIYASCRSLPDEIDRAFLNTMLFLLDEVPLFKPLPAPDFDRMNLEEFVGYRNLLHEKQYFFQNQAHLLELAEQAMATLMDWLTQDLPQLENPSPFTVPLWCAYPNLDHIINRINHTFSRDDLLSRGLFKGTREALYASVLAHFGKEERFKPPERSGLKGQELISAYLGSTLFERLLMTPVPLKLTNRERYSHMHIIGGTGAGKTTLIEHLILHDLQQDDPPALVLIDPHSDTLRKLVRADLGIADRLVLIDPRDIRHPPALNIFALNQERMAQYDEMTREQVTASAIQTFLYLFSGSDLNLTGKQEVFFRYCMRLLLSFPDMYGRPATILDMLELMIDETPYEDAIEQLPPLQRDFFRRDFAGPKSPFRQTKEQIRYRLQSIISDPTMERLFTAPATKVDFFSELNRGAVILIDTAKDFLKDGSADFGKLMISLILQAVLERAAIPAGERKPTFIFIDECAQVFDDNIDDLLTEVRKYNAGIVLAHQYLDQATGSLRASLNANTGIKFASGVSAGDASAMAREMRTTSDFILSQPRLQFAAHIRGVTPEAVSIPIKPVGSLRQLEDEAYQQLIERNRERVSLGLPTAPRTPDNPIASAPVQEPNEDISPEW